MKLGISQIAFKNYSLEQVLIQLSQSPVKGLEVAPTMIWKEPFLSSPAERQAVRDLFQEYGITLIGFQSVLYNCPHLKVFDSDESRRECLEHLKKMIRLCHELGGGIMSFGAPHNRKRGSLSIDEAMKIAVPFFQDLARTAEEEDIIFCLEPLAPKFGCDFIVTAQEGADFITRVGHPNVRLLLDTGSMFMNGEPVADVIVKCERILRHIHVNDPELTPVGARGMDHGAVSRALRDIDYRHWVTMEFLFNNVSPLESAFAGVDCYR